MADAHTSWSTSKPIVVVIDPARGEGLVRSAIHELLHVLLDDTMWPFSEEVEESIVSALEADIFANMEDEGWTHEFLALLDARVAATPPRVKPQPKASPLRSSKNPIQPEPITLELKDKARPS